MANYYINYDQKVTAWVRNTIRVDNVNSEKEALDKATQAAKKYYSVDDEEDIWYEDAVELCETEQPMSIEDNNGEPTIEFLDPNTKEVIWDNIAGYVKDNK